MWNSTHKLLGTIDIKVKTAHAMWSNDFNSRKASRKSKDVYTEYILRAFILELFIMLNTWETA